MPCSNTFSGLSGEASACQSRRCRGDPWVGKIPRRREWQPAPVFLPGEVHGQRSLVQWHPCDVEDSVSHRLSLAVPPVAVPWTAAGRETVKGASGLVQILVLPFAVVLCWTAGNRGGKDIFKNIPAVSEITLLQRRNILLGKGRSPKEKNSEY